MWGVVQYIDYVGSWGPAIVGHAHPEVSEALKEQIYKARTLTPTAHARSMASIWLWAPVTRSMVCKPRSGHDPRVSLALFAPRLLPRHCMAGTAV